MIWSLISNKKWVLPCSSFLLCVLITSLKSLLGIPPPPTTTWSTGVWERPDSWPDFTVKVPSVLVSLDIVVQGSVGKGSETFWGNVFFRLFETFTKTAGFTRSQNYARTLFFRLWVPHLWPCNKPYGTSIWNCHWNNVTPIKYYYMHISLVVGTFVAVWIKDMKCRCFPQSSFSTGITVSWSTVFLVFFPIPPQRALHFSTSTFNKKPSPSRGKNGAQGSGLFEKNVLSHLST